MTATVVHYATFVERRERLRRVGAAFRERDRADAAVNTRAATGESESGADEGVTDSKPQYADLSGL